MNEETSQNIVDEIITEIVDQVIVGRLESDASNELVTKSKQLFEKWNSLKVIYCNFKLMNSIFF